MCCVKGVERRFAVVLLSAAARVRMHAYVMCVECARQLGYTRIYMLRPTVPIAKHNIIRESCRVCSKRVNFISVKGA